MLLLQATVKRFQFDLYVNLDGQQMLISLWFVSKISLLEQIRWIKLHKARLNHQIFMLLGHNVLIYCSQLITVGRRNEALHKKLSVEVLHLILCEEKA